MNFEEAEKKALALRDERDWAQFHNPKDLAMSIIIEAAELLEMFQWSGADLEVAAKAIDADAKKYPVEKARGNARGYTQL